MSIQRVRSKRAKTEVLLADPSLKVYIPDSDGFDRLTVERMLEKYEMIYVKPINGTFGRGVIRIEKHPASSSPYRLQSGETKYEFPTFDDLFRKLLSVKKPKSYLSQQGIHLLKHHGRRFDLRVMVQKNPQASWETTGMIGRVAHPRKIVTNYHAGGTPKSVPALMSAHLSPNQRRSFEARLRKLGVSVAEALERKYPRLKEIGIDIAVDEQHKTWILEVNTLPDPFLFKKLPDKSIFRKMYAYATAYGRFKPRKRKS
ncbi:YheC/YheD family protein [Cohnella phaseoli]|uniref:YheC/D-like protein n=1 Tax=Cohnella phaseoli TaxID=456490 RepID=A0A3D9KA41_9BACL|nr:YheC/YheD family protein [Cohnella phaseoli]RED83391.1 YheC/D-like protein [Cohnella phaseoli]